MSFNRLPADATTRFPASRRAGPEPVGLERSRLHGHDVHDQLLPRRPLRHPAPDGCRAGSATRGGSATWLTLNLGVRYDVAWNDFVSPGVKPTSILINTGYAPFGVEDFGYRDNIRDLRDVAPRVGLCVEPEQIERFRDPRRQRHLLQHDVRAAGRSAAVQRPERHREHVHQRRPAWFRAESDAWRHRRPGAGGAGSAAAAGDLRDRPRHADARTRGRT